MQEMQNKILRREKRLLFACLRGRKMFTLHGGKMKLEIKMPVMSPCEIGAVIGERVPGYIPIIIIDGREFQLSMPYAMKKEELDSFIEEFNWKFGGDR